MEGVAKRILVTVMMTMMATVLAATLTDGLLLPGTVLNISPH